MDIMSPLMTRRFHHMSRYSATGAALKLMTVVMFIPILFSGCHKENSQTYQGYAEAEFVNISSSQSGKLEKLFVKRGEQVAKGSNLFVLECDSERIALSQAASELAAAQSVLNDYTKGARPQELDVIEAQLAQAVANADNAKKQLERNALLIESNAVSKAQFEDSAAWAKSTSAKVNELKNALRVAKLAKRTDQIAAQKERIKQLQSSIRQIQWRLDEKTLRSRGTVLVFDTLYREGEFVPAGGIIVRLLPPENIKIRFFVPQTIAEKLQIGESVTIEGRADHQQLPAHVTYISAEAEYTPPVIYSNETKEQLIFMVEAYPETNSAHLLHPGQPVEISLGH